MIPPKLGLCGCGHFGRCHAQKLSRLQGSEFFGLYDTNLERAQALSQLTGAPVVDWFELLAQCDAIVIATPAATHFELASQALSAGCSVLVEKPFTTALCDAESLCALAKSEDQILQVGHIERFNPAVLALRESCKFPEFLKFRRITQQPAQKPELNVVLDLMIHDLDLACWLCDSELTIEDVALEGDHPNENRAVVELRSRRGATISIVAARDALKPERSITAMNGAFHHANLLDQTLDGKKFAGDALEAELASFVHAVQTRTPPKVSAESAKQALSLALQILG